MATNHKSENEKKILIIGGSGFIGRNSIIKFTEYHLGKILNLDKEPSILGVKTIYILRSICERQNKKRSEGAFKQL
jgi:dTDP-D-glucose 4,6-dehydratase